MSKRINPADQAVAFFETAPLDQAAVVLSIVKGILARRQPKTKPAKATKPARQPNGSTQAGTAPTSR